MKEFAQDTAKAAMPIVGGVSMQWVHIADEFLTVVTHAVGFCAAVCGLIWYFRRMRKDFKDNP